MMKQISLMKRRSDLTMEEFIDYYENHHAKLGEMLFSKARRYVRRYVQPEKNPLTGEVAELDFDVILEIWWDSREDFETAMKGISGEVAQAARESGAKIFASSNNPAFSVIEYDSKVGAD